MTIMVFKSIIHEIDHLGDAQNREIYRMVLRGILIVLQKWSREKKMQVNEMTAEKSFTLRELWNEQHPLIHTWFLLSSLSICFMSAIFFIFP